MTKRGRIARYGALIAVALFFVSSLPSSSAYEQSLNNWHCAYAVNGSYDTAPSHSVAGDTSSTSFDARTNCLIPAVKPPGAHPYLHHYSVADGLTGPPMTHGAAVAINTLWGVSFNLFICMRPVFGGNDPECNNAFGRVFTNSEKYDNKAISMPLGASPLPTLAEVTVFSTDMQMLPGENNCERYGGDECSETTVLIRSYSGARTRSAAITDPTSDSTINETHGFSSFVVLDSGTDSQLTIAGVPQPMAPGDAVTLGSLTIALTLSEEGNHRWMIDSVDGTERLFVAPDLAIWELVY